MKIFLLGGTKDSINIIKHIKDNYNDYILTTTTTPYGADLALEAGSDEVIGNALLKDEIIDIIKNDNYDLLIDATHPFASHITQTSSSIANELNIPYIRFERPITNLKNIDTSHIDYVDSFEMAGKLIKSKYPQGNILHFAGANTMGEILKYVSSYRFYPRILKVKSSLEKCKKLKINPSHIISMNGAASLNENLELIEKYNGQVIITKESGDIGGVVEKIEAAQIKNINVVMIKRPEIKNLNTNDVVSNIDEFDEKLNFYRKKV